MDNETALHLYYIVLEAVANAAKHSNAKNVAHQPDRRQGPLCLERARRRPGVRPAGSQAQTGMGIRIMQYRARVIGATLNLRSTPGHGTEVTCVFLALPRRPAPDKAQIHPQAALSL